MKKIFSSAICFSLFLIGAERATAQNFSFNTSGAANSTNSMLEILQTGTSPTTQNIGLYVSHSGALSPAGTKYGFQGLASGASAAGSTHIGGYFSASGATNNYPGIFMGGNVGIGTTTPGANLSFQDLNNGANTADGITWYNPSPTSYGIFRSSGAWSAPNYQQLNLAWQTGVVIDGGSLYGRSGTVLQPTAGNVGIGITAPTSQLHTSGTVRFQNYPSGFLSTDASGIIQSPRSIAVSGNGVNVTNGNGVSGNPTLNLNYGSGLGSAAGAGGWPVGNFGQFENHGTYTDFNVTPNYWGWNYVQGSTNAPNATSAQWYRENISLGANYAGRGVGGYSLELAFPRYSAASAGVWMRTVENGTIGSWVRIDANAAVSSACGTANYIPKNSSSTSITCSQIYDDGTNVGIGTAGPSYKLQANGDIYANGGWMRVSGNQGLYFESWGGGWYMVDGTWIRSYNSKNVYIDQTLRADNGIISGAIGGLGAGTVHANSWIRGNGFQDYNGNTVIDQGGGWHRSYGATGWYNGTYGGGWWMNDATWIHNYNSKPIYIDGNGTNAGVFMGGNVGIGTSTPSYPLHVATGSTTLDYQAIFGNATANATTFGVLGQSASTAANVGAGIIGWNTSNGLGVGGSNNNLTIPVGGNGDGGSFIGTGTGLACTTSNPASYYGCYVSAGGVYSVNGYYPSDKRFKKGITSIANGIIEKIMKLNPCEYYYDVEKYPAFRGNEEKKVGLIAQELEEVFPGSVTNKKYIYDPTVDVTKLSSNHKTAFVPMVTGYYAVDYTSLIPYLIKGIQEQQKMIQDLQNQVKELKGRH